MGWEDISNAGSYGNMYVGSNAGSAVEDIQADNVSVPAEPTYEPTVDAYQAPASGDAASYTDLMTLRNVSISPSTYLGSDTACTTPEPLFLTPYASATEPEGNPLYQPEVNRDTGETLSTTKAHSAIAPDGTYTVGQGDSMSRIAQKVYGDANRWPEIYEYNKDAIGDHSNALRVGTNLRIPPEDYSIDDGTRSTLIQGARIEPQATTAEPVDLPASSRKEIAMAKLATENEVRKTMNDSFNGDPAAAVKNLQNIIDATEKPYKEDFVKQYKEVFKESPSEDVVNKAYYEQLMKGFVYARYPSFVEQPVIKDTLGESGIPFAGFDPKNLNPTFKTPAVSEMYGNFPASYIPPGTNHDPISINHLLSGLQFQTTHADSLRGLMTKKTAGVIVNSTLAEDTIKPLTGTTREIGYGGIYAAQSPELQKAFQKDPVGALKDFLAHPNPYIQSGKDTISHNPIDWVMTGYHEMISALRD